MKLFIIAIILVSVFWLCNRTPVIEGFVSSQPASYKRFATFQTPYRGPMSSPWDFYQSPWLMYGEPWTVPKFAYYQNNAVPDLYSSPLVRDFY